MLSACSVPPVPEVVRRPAMAPERMGALVAPIEWPAARWWADWGPSELAALIDQAVSNSPTLAIVRARVVQTEAAADVAAAASMPRLSANAELLAQRFSENNIQPPPLAGSHRLTSAAQLAGSWELDLFGKNRAATEAALGAVNAMKAEAQAARILLATQVAAAYVNLARLIDARRLAEQALEQRSRSLELVRQRMVAGIDSKVELRQAEGGVAQSRTEIMALEDAAARQRRALAELTGQGPDALGAIAPGLFPIKGVPVPANLPADLMGRRADLTAQRWRTESAISAVQSARAEFYPNINLTAFVGLASMGLDRFLSLGSRTYGVMPALRLPLFDAGVRQANLGSRAAEVDASIDAYNATLLRALREVADEVGTLRSLQAQQQTQSEALRAAESAYELALQRYRAGLGNYLTVLAVESTVIEQRRAHLELRARKLAAELGLVRALGGGFHEAPSGPLLQSTGGAQ